MNKGGRPLKFKTPEILEELVDKYFEECDRKEEPYTMTGLALALDTSRETLLDYDARDRFSDSIKKARRRCENYAEKYLFGGKNVVGAIFNLKNNYKRWKDKTETDIILKTKLTQEQVDEIIKRRNKINGDRGTGIHTDG